MAGQVKHNITYLHIELEVYGRYFQESIPEDRFLPADVHNFETSTVWAGGENITRLLNHLQIEEINIIILKQYYG